ncbi:MAG: DNA repair protein RecO [Deltaproteobacteria bacterium]|nr:DNA repair protein RecO [Deltaproteobacteria bacterium]
MSRVELTALVVKLIPFRESDRVAWLVSREQGLVSALVRGVRKSQKRFANVFDLGNLVRVRVSARRGGMPTVDSGEMIDGHWANAASVAAFAALAHVIEVTRRVSVENHAEPELFDAACLTLAALESGVRPVVLRVFEAATLAATGLAPNLTNCVVCGRAARTDDAARYSTLRGGIVCSRCLADHQLATIGPAARAFMGDSFHGPNEELLSCVLSKADQDALAALLPAQIEHHLGGPLVALRFARRLPKPGQVAASPLTQPIAD